MSQESSTKPANNKQQQNLIMILLLTAVVGLLIFKRGQAPQVSSQADQQMRIEALQSKIKSYETISSHDNNEDTFIKSVMQYCSENISIRL